MQSFGRAGGDKMLEGKVAEAVVCSEYEVKSSDFLTPPQQRTAFDIALSMGASERCFFWGGAFDAQRRALFMLPEWFLFCDGALGGAFDSKREELFHETMKKTESEELCGAVSALEIIGSGYETLCHRDCLGALLSLGIERDALGDIALMSENRAVVFVKTSAAEFIKNTLTSVGRDRVRVYGASLEDSFRVPAEFELVNETVMSERLDGIIKAVYKMPRETACSLVEKGDVALNYITETKPDRLLSGGDVVSVRGQGKFIYDGNGGVNRRGRIKIHVRKYL